MCFGWGARQCTYTGSGNILFLGDCKYNEMCRVKRAARLLTKFSSGSVCVCV